MLVCNVSLRPARVAIVADLAEAAAALDTSTTGTVVFATLIDDPAAVADIVNAFLGQIIVEAANATATVATGLTYAAAIAEATTSSDAANAAVPTVYAMTIAEPASANAAADTLAQARNAMLAGTWPIYVNGLPSRQAGMDGPIAINL